MKDKSIQVPEAIEQQQVFEWAAMVTPKWPMLKYMYHVGNGGSRHHLEAINLKRQGVKSGVPDICLPFPHGGFHGLYIEMKRLDGGRKTKEQKDYIQYLSDIGYKAVFCNGFEEAINEIKEYLKGA